MTVKVLIPMASGCEELEAVTLINIFRRAGFAVITAGLAAENVPVKCARGTSIMPDTILEQAMTADYDLLVLPGGQPGTDNLLNDVRIINLVQAMQQQDRHIAAICAAPMVLGKAGVLRGKRATSYPGCLEAMDLPEVSCLADAVVVDGKIVTSRGPGTAMDFALKLVEIMAGSELREKVERGLQRS